MKVNVIDPLWMFSCLSIACAFAIVTSIANQLRATPLGYLNATVIVVTLMFMFPLASKDYSSNSLVKLTIYLVLLLFGLLTVAYLAS